MTANAPAMASNRPAARFSLASCTPPCTKLLKRRRFLPTGCRDPAPGHRPCPATGVWASVVPRGGRRLTGQQFPQLSCKIFAV